MEKNIVEKLDIERTKELFEYEMTEVILKLKGEFDTISREKTRYNDVAVNNKDLKVKLVTLPIVKQEYTQPLIPHTEVGRISNIEMMECKNDFKMIIPDLPLINMGTNNFKCIDMNLSNAFVYTNIHLLNSQENIMNSIRWNNDVVSRININNTVDFSFDFSGKTIKTLDEERQKLNHLQLAPVKLTNITQRHNLTVKLCTIPSVSIIEKKNYDINRNSVLEKLFMKKEIFNKSFNSINIKEINNVSSLKNANSLADKIMQFDFSNIPAIKLKINAFNSLSNIYAQNKCLDLNITNIQKGIYVVDQVRTLNVFAYQNSYKKISQVPLSFSFSKIKTPNNLNCRVNVDNCTIKKISNLNIKTIQGKEIKKQKYINIPKMSTKKLCIDKVPSMINQINTVPSTEYDYFSYIKDILDSVGKNN